MFVIFLILLVLFHTFAASFRMPFEYRHKLYSSRGSKLRRAASIGDDYSRMKDFFVNPDSSLFEWYEFAGCNVVLPMNTRVPTSIIHYIGGFLAGSAVKASYQSLFEELASKGHLVVATPLPPFERNHEKLARDLEIKFRTCYINDLMPIFGKAAIYDIPVIGMGHSLGGKLTAIIDSKKIGPLSSSDDPVPYKKKCNVFLAFNNYGVNDSLEQMKDVSDQLSPEIKKLVDSVVNAPEIANLVEIAKKEGFANGVQKTISNSLERALGANNPLVGNLVGQVKDATSNLNMDNFEFNPTPEKTWEMVKTEYNVRQNYIIKFSDDSIDQSMPLIDSLSARGCTSRVLRLHGTHTTPLGRPNTEPSIDPTFVRRLAKILDAVADKECDFDFTPMGFGNRRYMIGGDDKDHDNY